MERGSRAKRARAAVACAVVVAGLLAPAPAAGDPGLTPMAVSSIFQNYSAVSGLSGNLSIHSPTRSDTEVQRGFLNGGRGACWTDFDADLDDDLYLVGPGASQLFRNDGAWQFTDVTNASGVWAMGYGMGCGAADLDRDGDEDIWATDYDNGDSIFRNNGDGTFANVTAASGVSDNGPHTGVAFGDFDNDALLDVVVTSYNRYQDLVYRNLGGLRFEEMQESSDLYDSDWGFQPLIFDYDQDGDVDLYAINDFGWDRMWRNDGNWTFTDVSVPTGAYDPGGGMGGDVADVDHDGDLDFYVANYNENALWVWNGTGYEDRAVEAGVANRSTGWAALFLDYDNDGWDDLYVVNGAVDTYSVRFQSSVLYRGLGGLRFEDVSNGSGAASAEIGRGAAWSDVDGDGRVDVYKTNINAPNEMLRNTLDSMNRWVGLRLKGTVSNPDGVGALVTVRAGNLTQVKPVLVGTGYLGSHSKVLHFGLGDRDAIDAIEIRWPSGLVQDVPPPAVNGSYLVVEQDDELPSAVAPDISGLRGVPMDLNGSASADNVRIVAWNWSVDDNGTPRNASGETAKVAVYTAGNHTGTLTVRDLFGNTASTSFNVDVGAFSGAWADAGPDFALDEGATHAFVAGGGTSETPDFEGTSNFTWSFTDGGAPRTLYGARPNYTFTNIGVVEVRLHVVDLANQTGDDFVNVTVRDMTPPSPVSLVPAAVDEDVPVFLDATASQDNDPAFPAGATAEWSYLAPSGLTVLSGFNVSATFPDPGPVSLMLRVTDAAGNAASLLVTLTVRDRTAPVAAAGGDRAAFPGEPVVFSAAGSTDNAGDLYENGNFTWTVHLPSGAKVLYGPETVFVFTGPGVYRVDLWVSDPSGNPGALPASFNVTVDDNQPPTPDGGGNRVVAFGAVVTLDASGSTDNDPLFHTTGTFVWEFQDGDVLHALPGLRVNYTFGAPGEYRIRLSVRDAAGNAAALVFSVTVGDGTPPDISADELPAELPQGQPLALHAIATDNWRLGSLSWRITGPFAFDVTLEAAAGTVPLGLPGAYHVTATATDLAGNQATWEREVRVTAALPNPGGNGTGGGGNGTGGGSGPPPPSPSLLGPALALTAGGAAGLALALYLRRSRRPKGGAPPQAE